MKYKFGLDDLSPLVRVHRSAGYTEFDSGIWDSGLFLARFQMDQRFHPRLSLWSVMASTTATVPIPNPAGRAGKTWAVEIFALLETGRPAAGLEAVYKSIRYHERVDHI